MTKHWVAIDKQLATTFSEIRREYSKIEAMFSYSLDLNCGKTRSLRGYSRMWSWSVWKVKAFIENINNDQTLTEQQPNSNQTPYHVISLKKNKPTEQQPNSNQTLTEHKYKEQEQEQETTTTIAPKKRSKKKVFEYSEEFEKFWEAYPRKKGKFKAFASWEKYDCGNGLFEQIMLSLENQKTDESWTKDEGKFIPHGSTWVNSRGWEDDTSSKPAPIKLTGKWAK